MLNRPEREQNFIERRRQWKAKADKPLGRNTLLMILPAIVLCVFALMAAPYLKLLMNQFARGGDELKISIPLNLEDEPEKVEAVGPPPSPEQVALEAYRARLEREGFDWRAKPELEMPEKLGFARDREVVIEPLSVELPTTVPRSGSESDLEQ